LDISTIGNHGSAPQEPPPQQTATADQRKLVQAVKAVDAEEVFGQHTELRFVMDRASGRMQVRIINRKTGEVLNQMPPEYVLYIAEEKSKR
jgi:uncharacterized FlaG/YvyC family protein